MQLLSFSERYSLTAQQWQNKGAKIQIISAETLSNFGFGQNRFETRISAAILLHFPIGFGMLESGCVSLKNEVNIMMKNVVDVVFGGVTYWAFGYGLSYGQETGSNPFMGVGSWFVNAEGLEMGPTYTTFLFQLSFATTATTIVSGGIAER